MAQSGSLGIYPTGLETSARPWFQLELQPGEALRASVTIKNTSTVTQSVKLYPADAVQDGDGGFRMAPAAAPKHDVACWIKLSQTKIALAPGSSEQITFNARAPDHAAIGPHFAGIIAEPEAGELRQGSGLALNVITRVGVRVYVNVPGETHPRATVSNLSFHWRRHVLTAQMDFRNSGNTVVTPTGELQLFDPLLTQVHRSSVQSSHLLLPGEHQSIAAQVGLRPLSPLIHVRLSVDHTQSIDRWLWFWPGVAMWILVAIGCMLLVWIWRCLQPKL